MNWLLPIALVLVAAVLMAAAHFVFMRWMARQPEPARIQESDSDGSTSEQT